MRKPDGRKDDKPKGLGFFYPQESAVYVDADEYRALIDSGRLSEDETRFLRQFLKEYYGRRAKSDVVIHDSNSKLLEGQRCRRRDVTLVTEAATTYSRYTSADYFAPRANPEEIMLLGEELSIRSQKTKRKRRNG